MSKRKRKNKKSIEYIPIRDAIYVLRISPRKMQELLASKKIIVYKNDFNFPSLKIENFKKLAYCEDIPDARIEAIYYNAEKRVLEETADNNKRYLGELEERIKIYDGYIDDLKKFI